MEAMQKYDFYQSTSPKLRIILLVFGLITLSGIGILIAPRVLSLYYQARGGQSLEYIFDSDGTLANGIACERPSLVDETSRSQVVNAIHDLEKSIMYRARESHSYLLLGRAYCLLDNPDEAVRAYRSYIDLRPNNPLGHIELAFAYADLNEAELFTNELQFANLSVQDLIIEGDIAYDRHIYDVASRWYELSAKVQKSLESSVLFKWTIASIVANQEIPSLVGDSILPVYVLNEDVLIEAENLQWLFEVGGPNINYGTKLRDSPARDSRWGVLWWSGAAVTAVDVRQSGAYLVTIRAQNRPPAPIELQFEHNMNAVESFALHREDLRWEDIEIEIFLEEGPHVLGIRFLNDRRVNGVDRNAVLDWIKLEKKSE